MLAYSVIIPVYNRPDEIQELLQSLALQHYDDMEIIIVEDGSSIRCDGIIEAYADKLNIKYYYKENTGPGDSRNFGMEKSSGNYLLFFDSDCVLPPDYFTALDLYLNENPLDAFGGADRAHSSFTKVQKAINYAMTSFITTGGIRGGKKQVSKFQPRSFNMGLKKTVYDAIGGFSDVHPGEDPELSFRILDAGYKTGFVPTAYVYHKRRIDFQKFALQVYKFGVVRVFLNKWFPSRKSIVYIFPSLFLLGLIFLVACSLMLTPIFLLPIAALMGLIMLDALIQTKSITIAFLSIATSFVQLLGYGYGYLKSHFFIRLLGRNERSIFPSFFFSKK